MASPHSPRPTRVASYALHFQIPILPMPTPPSLLKRQSSVSSDNSLLSTNMAYSASLPGSAMSSATCTPVTTPSPRVMPTVMTPTSPIASFTTHTRSSPISCGPGVGSATARAHRRVGSAPSSLTCSPVIPATPYSTPLDNFEDMSFPVFGNNTRPPIVRRDTPRPGARSRNLEVDEFDAQFGEGLGIMRG